MPLMDVFDLERRLGTLEGKVNVMLTLKVVDYIALGFIYFLIAGKA